MKVNLGPGLQQLSQTIGNIAQISGAQSQHRAQMAFAADENLYGSNARSATLKVQDFMRELVQDASTRYREEGFDLDAAGEDLSGRVYEFYEANAGQWMANDRYKERFASEVLGPLVAEMRNGVDETAFQVKNELAAEQSLNTINDGLSMLQKGARPEGVYEILMDAFKTYHAVYPMSRSQYDQKLEEINGTFNTTLVQTGIASVVNSGRFSGEEILNIVSGISGRIPVDGEEPWQVQAKIIKNQLKVREDPTRSTETERAYLDPFSDAKFEELNSYAKSLLGVREAEQGAVIQEHAQKMTVHFDELMAKDPDAFTYASVVDYVAGDKVLSAHQDDAAYALVKGLKDKAKQEQDNRLLRNMTLYAMDQDYADLLGPIDDTKGSVTIGTATYGIWSEMESTLRDEFRSQTRPKFFSEANYQQAEDMYINSVSAQYSQDIMTGLFAEYDGDLEKYNADYQEYLKKTEAGEDAQAPAWEHDRASVDADSRFDLLGPEMAQVARDALYDQFTRNELTPEAQQARSYAMLRPTAMNQFVSKDVRLQELGRHRANLSKEQYKDLETLVNNTPAFSLYGSYSNYIDQFADELVRGMFGLKADADLNARAAISYERISGQLQKAFDDHMLEHPDDMTNELAQAWVESNLDAGNKDLVRFLKYNIGDEADWKGETGQDALRLFQDGRVDKDLMPTAYGMLGQYTDSLMESVLGVKPSDTSMMATDKGVVYFITAQQTPQLASWAEDQADNVQVSVQWMIDEKNNTYPVYGIEKVDDDGTPTGEWEFFMLENEKPPVHPGVVIQDMESTEGKAANLMFGTGGIGPTYQQNLDMLKDIEQKPAVQPSVSEADTVSRADPTALRQIRAVSPSEDAARMDRHNASRVVTGQAEAVPSVTPAVSKPARSAPQEAVVEPDKAKTLKASYYEIPEAIRGRTQAAVVQWIRELERLGVTTRNPDLSTFQELADAGLTQEQLETVYRWVASEGGRR